MTDLLIRAETALRRLTAAGAIRLFVACTPVPPDRKVSAQGKIYWGKTYSEVAATLQREFSVQLPAKCPHDRPVVVALESVLPKPKRTTLRLPKPDTENLAKSPLDAVTKTQRVWEDDTQVEWLIAAKRWTEPGEDAGVHLIINTMEP